VNELADARQMLLLGVALAIGLLIGIERGWKQRQAEEGKRIAGLRSFGLIALLGGVSGLLAQYLDVIAFGFVFAGFTLAATVAYAMQWRDKRDISITSLVTMLLTFILGAMVTLQHVSLAASIAVVTVMLLRFKNVLHSWLKKLDREELHAALQLLLISVVLLPLLPDRGYGPWQALNPYEIWWMVVLIAGISFIGYFAMRIAGTEKGVILTALAAGMASSTALTLHYAQLFRQQPPMKHLLSAGILLACATMFPRVLLIASLINIALLEALLPPLAMMTALTLTFALINWRQKNSTQAPAEIRKLINPLQLKPALVFGLLLMLVLLLGKAAVHFFGDTGIYLLALVSGIADVDPINLTLSRMSSSEITLHTAVIGIVIASSTNTLVKAGLAVFAGGRELGIRVFIPLLLAAAGGLTTAWLW
jgi:uncharacterized membrane protein (DUF4010 family)